MKYKSEIIAEILEKRGHEMSSLHYAHNNKWNANQTNCINGNTCRGNHAKLSIIY